MLVVIEEPPLRVVIEETSIYMVAAGAQGPAGVAGAPGPTGGVAVQHTAGVALGGHRMVVLDNSQLAIYADCAISAHAHKVLGMTSGAVVSGDTATIQTGGEMTEPSWNWTLGTPVWLSTNGQLTQTVPTTGFSLIIGFPISATTLFVSKREPLILN